jgi:putative ABC transport system permease protein
MRLPVWRGKRQQQLKHEIDSHLEMAKLDRLDRGEPERQAAQAALREFGNVALVQSVARDQWGWIWVREFFEDLHYAARMMRRNAGLTLVAVLTLVLGIGANTAIFSLVNGVLLRGLPFPQPDRLVALTQYYPKGAFVMLREQSRTMDVIANTDGTQFNLTGTNLPERLTGTAVSADWFAVLQTHAAMGRTFQEGDNQPGKSDLVILSHSLWASRFASAPNIVGRSILLDGISRQVVGVMPAAFRFPSPKTELWVPLTLDPRNRGEYWGSSYMPISARLRPSATLDQARADLTQLGPKLLAAFPWRMPDNAFQKSSVISMQEAIVGDARASLLVLLGAVAMLLLIACANVANLLLARAAARQKEIALRAALGASRWRIVRQLVSESVLMSALGGAFGLVAAQYSLALLKSTLPADLPRLEDVSVDARVLIFTALLSVLTGICFGLAPAAGASKVDLTKSLKTGGDRTGTSGTNRLSGILVIGEVAISVVLVVAAGLLVKSLWNLSNSNPGFRSEHIVTARLTPNQSFCKEPGRCQAFYNELLARVRALPGVKDAAAVNGLPLGGSYATIPSDLEGYAVPAGAHVPMLMERVATPDYLRVMGIPLLQGRAFAEADAAENGQRVALISKSTAERYWPGKDPIGQHLKPRWLDPWWTIVGVVGDVRENSMSRNLPEWLDGEIYTPYGPHAINESGPEAPPAELTLVVRSPQDAKQFAGDLQSVVSQLNGDVPVTQIETLTDWVAEAVAGPRSTASLFSLFAALALVLGAVGVYGVISYLVAQRTREIGIRMAMGARRAQILCLIVGQGTRLAVGGVFIGLLGALLLTRLLSSLLYGVGSADPSTYFAVALLLVGVAIAASYIPARRAMRVDPVVALHYE